MTVSCCNVRLITNLRCVHTKVPFLADPKPGDSLRQCSHRFNVETIPPLFKGHLNKTVLTQFLLQSNKLSNIDYTIE